VLSGCELDLRSIELMHIDTSYVRGAGEVDWASYFAREDLSGLVKAQLPDIPEQTKKLFGVLASQTPPSVPPGKHCTGYCPFWDRCTKDKPDDWVFNLPRITGKQLEKLSSPTARPPNRLSNTSHQGILDRAKMPPRFAPPCSNIANSTPWRWSRCIGR
jgi:hypothetical protein